mmetsp:Transcript_30319/g.102297  ORF Transcript_30319/g.102297 Transcript_30319/m.102297 type:complete len:258 (+) Transcript_30319:1707-2480(+)
MPQAPARWRARRRRGRLGRRRLRRGGRRRLGVRRQRRRRHGVGRRRGRRRRRRHGRGGPRGGRGAGAGGHRVDAHFERRRLCAHPPAEEAAGGAGPDQGRQEGKHDERVRFRLFAARRIGGVLRQAEDERRGAQGQDRRGPRLVPAQAARGRQNKHRKEAHEELPHAPEEAVAKPQAPPRRRAKGTAQARQEQAPAPLSPPGAAPRLNCHGAHDPRHLAGTAACPLVAALWPAPAGSAPLPRVVAPCVTVTKETRQN